MGNKGAFIKFLGKDMKPKFVQFTAVVIIYFYLFNINIFLIILIIKLTKEHPKVPVMAYSKSMYNFY